MSIVLCFKGPHVFDDILSSYGIKDLSLSILFYFFILFVGSMTSISSSSISLEGKTINITKSLPIKEKLILQSKILTCYVIELPFILFSDIVFFIRFKPSLFYCLLIVLLSILTIFFSACMGLVINLKYPKMDATNDTEVVKQSMSSIISIFIGLVIFFGSILIIFFLNDYVNMNLLLVFHVIFMGIICAILYIVLMRFGTKEYRKIGI